MPERRDLLTLIKRRDGPGLALARRYPGDEHLRTLAVEHWGHASHSPREQDDPGIDIPVSPREQVAYEVRLPRSMRDALNGLAPAPTRGYTCFSPWPVSISLGAARLTLKPPDTLNFRSPTPGTGIRGLED